LKQFDDFGVAEPLLRAVGHEGYTIPTPIQQQAIPYIMDGRDICGCAQTGTGKTAAFALPILHRLMQAPRTAAKRPIRSLVLTPTRELAAQVGESFAVYGKHSKLRSTTIFGGVRQGPQVDALAKGVDILVATPGRLIDLMQQGYVKLEAVEVLVLDEADRMLDMGFIQDVRRIVSRLPKERQTLLFSATIPPKVQQLSDSILTDAVYISVTPEAPTAENVDQAVYFVDHHNKRDLLAHLLKNETVTKVLVFTRTKHGADRVQRNFKNTNITADTIHSNKSQGARTRALESFKNGKTRVLVASDIAARGIDVEDISHVINYDLPQEPEIYVHRIGRTGRAGATGIALTFCDPNERTSLEEIESLIGERLSTIIEHPWHSPIPSTIKQEKRPQRGRRSSQGPPRRSGRPSGGQRSAPARPQGQQDGANPRRSRQAERPESGDSAPRRRRRSSRGRTISGGQAAQKSAS